MIVVGGVKRVRTEKASLEVLALGGIAKTTGKITKPAINGACAWIQIFLSNGGVFDCNSTTLEESTEEEYLRYLLAGRP